MGKRQGNLAVKLLVYGGNSNNLELLKEAFVRLLDAFDVAESFGLIHSPM
jgi:hypothetical protein